MAMANPTAETKVDTVLRLLRSFSGAYEEHASVIEVLRRDAARYRYLRSRTPSDSITVEALEHSNGLCHLAGNDLDAVVDQEMSK
jgi:hexokinase